MRKILIVIFTCLLAYAAQGQSRLIGERSIFTQYYLTPFLVNPAASGQNDYSQVIANYRNTWASFPGSPKTFTFGYDGNLGNRIGISLTGLSDSFGAFGTTKGGLSLSYTITTPDHKIGFGIGGEYISYSLKGEAVTNLLVNPSDVEIMNHIGSNAFLDASFGIYGLYKNKIIYGIAFPSAVSVGLGDNQNEDKEFGFIANLGYRMEVPEKDIVFEPSIYAKKLMFVPFHVDINLKADFLNEQLTAGLIGSVGAENRIGFLIGTQINNFGFNYTYNMSLNEFQSYNNGSHELGLRFKLQPYRRQAPPVDGE